MGYDMQNTKQNPFPVDKIKFHDSDRERISLSICNIINIIGGLNRTWWKNPRTGKDKNRNVGEVLMLVVSELSEALEGHRKSLSDDKLPQYKMFDVEIADALIRLFDLAFHWCPDLDKIIVDKLVYNCVREDHKPENRIKKGGKKY